MSANGTKTLAGDRFSRMQRRVLYWLGKAGPTWRRSLTWICVRQIRRGERFTGSERASFSRSIGRLQAAGLVSREGGRLALTDTGRAIAIDMEADAEWVRAHEASAKMLADAEALCAETCDQRA